MEGLEIIQASAAVAKGENVKLLLGDISFSTCSEENMQMIYGKDLRIDSTIFPIMCEMGCGIRGRSK